jgi:hypothetical protein
MAVETGAKSVTITATDDQVQTVYASAARTATPTTFEGQKPQWARGLHLIIDATASAATPSVVFTILGYSPLGDDAYTILASAAVTGAATTVLKVYPGLTAAANLVANDMMPARWRVTAVHGDADSLTYSVAALWSP